ncbi:MAG: hypothetical protein Q4C54_04110, partial [Clostridia bacterium]|nr:hypothetical protein [Clostridia bacterium]
MSGSKTYKCPSCGAYLEFDPATQRLKCPYCGASFQESELNAESEKQSAPEVRDTGSLKTYHCKSCGAQIVTSETTAATRCYYCHSPIVLTDRLDGDMLPDGVLPFEISEKDAKARFTEYLQKKRFVDRKFFSSAQLEMFSGVYYPYWLGTFSGTASFSGSARKVHTVNTPRFIETHTRHFTISRKGTLKFPNMFRKALKQTDRQLSDGIFPYKLDSLKPFDTSCLSGFVAEKRDIDEAPVMQDMLAEASAAAAAAMSDDLRGPYEGVTGSASFEATKKDMRYVLLPA